MSAAASGTGVNSSEAALAVARRNAGALPGRARTISRGDWSNCLGGTLISWSNPPYIPSAEIDRLEPEVACYEPRLALDGGKDGLDAYRAIARWTPHLLANKGQLIVEFGAGQAEAVCAIFAQHGITEAQVECDLAGRPRCVIATV